MLWRLKYRFLGKERTLSFGAYPVVSPADARDKREAAKKLLANGKDPSAEKRIERLAMELAARNTFGLIAAEYIENLETGGKVGITVEKNRWLLQDLANRSPIVPSRRSLRRTSRPSEADRKIGRRKPPADCAASSVQFSAWPSSPCANRRSHLRTARGARAAQRKTSIGHHRRKVARRPPARDRRI